MGGCGEFLLKGGFRHCAWADLVLPPPPPPSPARACTGKKKGLDEIGLPWGKVVDGALASSPGSLWADGGEPGTH